MVNNFEFLKTILHFDSPDDFYFIELLKRRKDNPTMSKSQKTVDVYEISCLEEYDELKDKIIQKCHYHNCRAYLSVNVRSRKKIALELLREVSNRIANDNFNVRNIYRSMLGKYHSSKEKKWIVDIDYNDFNVVADVIRNIKEIKPDFTYVAIPTLNGYHLICSPFNSKAFSYKNNPKEVSIHTNNSTLLYFNGSEGDDRLEIVNDMDLSTISKFVGAEAVLIPEKVGLVGIVGTRYNFNVGDVIILGPDRKLYTRG